MKFDDEQQDMAGAAYSPDGKRLVAGGNAAREWSTFDGKPLGVERCSNRTR